MKIAFISTISSWGGSEELWGQSALKLKGNGHQVFASVISWIRSCDQVVNLANCGIQVETHSPHLGFARRALQNFKYGGPKHYHRLKSFDPDLIVISQGHNSGGFGWAKFAREISKPYAMIMQCNGDQWWFGEQLGAAIDSYTNAKRVFCASHNNLDLLRLQIGDPLPNAEVIWNPFSVSPDIDSPWPAESGTWRMVCPARLFPPAKGQELLLQTLALPEWRGRPIQLNFFGSGPDELALRRLAAMLDLENVEFRGFSSDLSEIWKENHLLVLPSRFEGLPIVLMDAMWCRRPAVVTDVGDSARMCIDGETGFVASSPTLGSVSNALERAWQRRNEWQQMGLAARKRAEDLIPRDPVSVFCDRLKNCVLSPQ
jgi:glycosyltransferase involved in cell wall biosynthesis